jgi:putative spermidine/putrescine transport system permease protein
VETRGTRFSLAVWAAAVVFFLWFPLVLICLYAFNSSNIQSWPIAGFTLHWFSVAWHDTEARSALWLSLEAALLATSVALVLGTMAAFAVSRFRFFGREVFSLSLVVPIALPGIVTGLALNASARTAGISFSTFTIVLGHATFCIVVVYNNVIARLRRSSRSIEEASMDLGADTWQTFRYITFPVIRTAVLAGGLLAFALSFDEIVVTTFTAGTQETIPIWIFNHLRQANQRPIVNVVALVLILLSTIPVYLASRLTTGTATSGRT